MFRPALLISFYTGAVAGFLAGLLGARYIFGRDWDATVVKIVENPISIRQAFWSPYKRISRMISQQIEKLAADQFNRYFLLHGLAVELAEGLGLGVAAREKIELRDVSPA